MQMREILSTKKRRTFNSYIIRVIPWDTASSVRYVVTAHKQVAEYDLVPILNFEYIILQVWNPGLVVFTYF